LLALYIEFGISIFKEFDGMFAFAISDRKKNKIILGRDRTGKKPLYFQHKHNKLLFSSELNTMKILCNDLNIDNEEVYSYIRNGFFYSDTTPYINVKQVKPGHIYSFDLDTLKLSKNNYFKYIDYFKKEKVYDFDYARNKVDLLLHDSIKSRLIASDVEVGAFLSGGIDSSLIVAIASQYVDQLKTFTVRFEGGYDESYLANLTAQKYGTKHTVIDITMNLKDDIEKILLNYGEPFMDSSAIPSYYVAQEAKKHVSVILNGDGADELFGGYRRYVPAANNLLSWARYLNPLLKILPASHNKKSLYNYFYRLLEISNKSGLDYYLSSTSDVFEGVYEFKNNHILRQIDKFLLSSPELSNLSRMLFHDSEILLFSDLLVKIDISTMSNSLEGRSPFLSKYMLEFAPTLPDNLKIKGVTTKFILRELAKKYLPLELINQPKRGFEVPLKKWVNVDLNENIRDRLVSNSYSSSFIDQGFINKLLDDKIMVSDEKKAKMIWSMYCLEVWKDAQ